MYPCLYLASSTIQSEKQILRSKSSKQSMLTSLLEEKSNSSTSQEKSEAPGHSSSKQEIFGAVSYHHEEFPDELMEDESYGRLSVEESMAPGGLPKEEGVAHESEQDTPGGLPKEEGVARESEQDTPGGLPKVVKASKTLLVTFPRKRVWLVLLAVFDDLVRSLSLFCCLHFLEASRYFC